MGWMKGVAVGFMAIAVAFTATGAYAEGRPVSPLGDNGGPGGGELNLQEVLNSITTAGPGFDADAAAGGAQIGQSSSAVFTPTAGGSSVATFVIEISGLDTTNQFGIYDASNPANKVDIFVGANSNPDLATVTFLVDGSVLLNGTDTTANFTLDGNGRPNFGFYLDVVGNGDPYTLYSEDGLNPGKLAQALIYQGDNATELGNFGFVPAQFQDDQWLIAFEDLIRDQAGFTDQCQNHGGIHSCNPVGSSDSDFQDLIVLVDNLTPVPEPATLLLLGSGLVGTGFFGRKRLARKQS